MEKINIDNYNRVFFTSNIDICSGKQGANKRDAEFINNWNKKVSKKDLVIIVGDISNNKEVNELLLAKSLNGVKILVKGDKENEIYNEDFSIDTVEKICDIIELEKNNFCIVVSYYPMLIWHGIEEGSINVYGIDTTEMFSENSCSVGYKSKRKIIEWNDILEELGIIDE